MGAIPGTLYSIASCIHAASLPRIDCSDRPDQNVSDPDRLIVYYIFFAAAIFPPFVGGEIKPLSFHQSTHLVDFTLFRAATTGDPERRNVPVFKVFFGE